LCEWILRSTSIDLRYAWNIKNSGRWSVHAKLVNILKINMLSEIEAKPLLCSNCDIDVAQIYCTWCLCARPRILPNIFKQNITKIVCKLKCLSSLLDLCTCMYFPATLNTWWFASWNNCNDNSIAQISISDSFTCVCKLSVCVSSIVSQNSVTDLCIVYRYNVHGSSTKVKIKFQWQSIFLNSVILLTH